MVLPSSSPSAIRKSYPNIVLVEDSQADAELIRMQVKSVWPDSKVTVVDSLAKSFVAYDESKPDLFLLDLNLPDGFGPRSVEELMSFSRGVPVLVITGMESMLTMNEAIRYGAKGVVFKDKIMTEEFKETLLRTIKM